MSIEKKVQCFLRRALTYSEGMDKDKDREDIVVENLVASLDLISSSCSSCSCECQSIFKKEK